jgi:P4 family phage/plasmid primase-like protien
MIPQQLKQRGIKFVLLEKGGKKPFQKEWQNKNIEYDDAELLEHLNNGGNYGVGGGGGKNLIIIDFDNENVQNQITPKLPRTFTVKTGTGKLHKYFFSDRTESFKIFDEDMNTLADVQGEGKQVVGAGSIHPNGNSYEVFDNSEIVFINYAEIKALLTPYDKKPKKEEKKFEKPKLNIQDDFLDTLKSSLRMEDVLSSFGINTSINPTACLFHSSAGGKCLGFNNETAHCFHCDGSWNVFSFVKQAKNCDFKESLEYLSNLAGLQDELEISRRRFIDNLKAKQYDKEREIKEEYLSLIKDKKWGDASELLVGWLLDNNYFYTTKDDQKSESWVYKEGIYIPQGKSEIRELLRNLLGNWYSTFTYNLVMSKIEPDTYIEADTFFNKSYVDEVPVLNGILNIRSRELKPFTPEKVFFNKLPVEYNPNAACPKIDKFLSEILAKEEDRDVFYELGGFCLLKEYKFEKAFMFVGNGRNGKDKSLELIKRLIGIENCCSVPLSSIIPDSFIISEFFNKMVNLSGEINNVDLKDTSQFKALTGRSLQSAPRKFLKPVNFINHAKFIFACNELPMVYDNSKGFWDRWVLLDFPYTFLPKEEIETSKDKTNLKLRDEDIVEKITTPEELSGLLNKFLDGLDRLMDFKRFSSTQGSEEIKQIWIRKSNSCMAFCLSEVEDNYDLHITKKEFRKRYSEFCKKHKITARSDIVIKRTLEELFGASEENKFIDVKWDKVWGGVMWRKKDTLC